VSRSGGGDKHADESPSRRRGPRALVSISVSPIGATRAPRRGTRPRVALTLSSLADCKRERLAWRSLRRSSGRGDAARDDYRFEARAAARKSGQATTAMDDRRYRNSLLVRGIELDVLPTAQRHGMDTLTYSPLAGGWLSGSWTADSSPTSPARQRLVARFDMSLPENQRKLESHRAARQGRRRRRPVADRASDRLRGQPPGGDLRDRRPTHDGAARQPTSRR
jgi:hypothetical protein